MFDRNELSYKNRNQGCYKHHHSDISIYARIIFKQILPLIIILLENDL